MGNRTAFVLMVCLVASLVVAGGCNEPGGKGLTKSLLSSHEKSARDYFEQQWEKRFLRCGDTYYGRTAIVGFGEDVPLAYAFKTSPGEWRQHRSR